jgi:hypothetical protein
MWVQNFALGEILNPHPYFFRRYKRQRLNHKDHTGHIGFVVRDGIVWNGIIIRGFKGYEYA